jgi:hypothetical protein
MVSYGVPAGLLIIIPILLLLIFAIKKIFKKNIFKKEFIFDKAWIVSLFVLISSQLVDVQYFDGRISLLVWILLSGTKNIITDKSIKYQQT